MKKILNYLYYVLGIVVILLALGFIPINSQPIGCSASFIVGFYDCEEITEPVSETEVEIEVTPEMTESP